MNAVGAAIILYLLGIGIFGWYVYYKLTGAEVSLHDGSVVYKARTGETRLPLERISCLEFPSVKYLGGWLRIVTPSSSIRLTVVLEGIDQFLLELKEALDANGLSDVYDRDRFFQFLKTSAYSDQSWARVYRLWWALLLNATLSTIWGYVCGTIANHGLISLLLSFMLAGASLASFWGAELYLGRYFANATDKENFSYPAPDPAFENRVYIISTTIWWGFCLVLLASLMQLM